MSCDLRTRACGKSALTTWLENLALARTTATDLRYSEVIDDPVITGAIRDGLEHSQ